jgi:hypothetical protein
MERKPTSGATAISNVVEEKEIKLYIQRNIYIYKIKAAIFNRPARYPTRKAKGKFSNLGAL